ncbi:polyprenyl synthetase family protein [Candidatus Pelagibacter sp.]|nr:polyprenyl synthetase family protein [Candidatus Pelagibacter sp.]|tara:strand:- start:543 stop:1412 length:870 start_codon:yes stop_codon:yes gene_type:complete
MEKKLKKLSKRVNYYLNNYISSFNPPVLIGPMKYGLFPGGKKIRSKIIFDVGKIFKVKNKDLLILAASVEAIHSYSLIHDDLPCMDDDKLRRGKPSTHVKFGESTAILAGNSLLTTAFEILSDKSFKINAETKSRLINFLSRCSGQTGIAGGQYLDLSYEKKKVSLQKILNMELKKTGKLFEFCCVAPLIIKKNKKYLNSFSKIGKDIGLLFQIVDDLIDFKGKTKLAGKKTQKDIKKGKATIISLLGYKNAVKYAYKLKQNIYSRLKKHNTNAKDLKETINFIMERNS